MDGQEYVFSHTDVRELLCVPREGCEFSEAWPVSDEAFAESLVQSIGSSKVDGSPRVQAL